VQTGAARAAGSVGPGQAGEGSSPPRPPTGVLYPVGQCIDSVLATQLSKAQCMDFKPTYNPYWSTINGGLTQTPEGLVISILQNDCGNANHKSARPFFDRLDPGTHHIIAVQELYVSARTKATHRPPSYHLAYRPDASTT
jgi:hypothetical protein